MGRWPVTIKGLAVRENRQAQADILRAVRPAAAWPDRPAYLRVPMPAKRLLNFATWPPVSIMRWMPVQAG